VLARSGFAFSLPPASPAVGTGGTVATARAVLGAREGRAFEATAPTISLGQMRELLASVGGLPLPARQKIAGLPPARADVFPAAVATLIAVAEAGRFERLENSLYNLRYGLAAELLD
jgi:exopolyphosphatase/guanosine-5'-triphosphate,3'-diphosphate pyrophosphatase